ncbi:hypothetical protein COLO4_11579 [Corchorus olitorius]|uniref:Uncharacterized protein n=1 Tax=Corchorus olitorius TaxID=93759 RepID=A0A1R3K3Y1_9ROSI|nr:hypothetical protein COLO4_11579 [Corchorus olitorius]
MIRPKMGFLHASLIFLLVFSSIFSPKLVVFGSSLRHLKRPDPLRHLKDYNGVYNVTNMHYWASAAYTGVHGYAMAGVWTFCGACFGIFLIFKNICCRNNDSSSSLADQLDRYSLLLFLSFVLLTLLAISIRNLITALTRIQYLLLPYDKKTSQQLNVTTHRIGRQSRTIQHFVINHEHSINVAIQASYIAHLAVATVNLLSGFAALATWTNFVRNHTTYLVLVIIKVTIFVCWILTAVCWFLTGIDVFLHTFAADSCTAFEDYVQEPQNNTLSSILPCLNSTDSDRILIGIGSTLHNFIGHLNQKIAEIYSKLKVKEQNEESFEFGMICDPFTGAPNYTYAPEDCPDDAIPIGDIPDILSSFTCYSENATKKCLRDGKFVPEDAYNKASAYSNSVQAMLNVFPDLQNLAECTMVKDTFSEVFMHQCRPFRRSLKWLWASMLSLSVCMVFLEFTWIIKAYHEKGRSFSRCSIFPNLRQSNNSSRE